MYSFRKKLLLYYLGVFLIFLIFVGFFQYYREKEYKMKLIESNLYFISSLTDKYIEQKALGGKYYLLDSLYALLPNDNGIRITIIASGGEVLYDSYVKNYQSLENHYFRPEIIEARKNGLGTKLRRSASTGRQYYYFAMKAGDVFVRTAKEYDMSVANFMKVNKMLFVFLLLVFLLIFVLLMVVTAKFSISISKLKDFALNVHKNNIKDRGFDFPDDEIGLIGKRITEVYANLSNTQAQLKIEKERLYRHLAVIREGIALFSHKKEILLFNKNFIRYANLISKKPIANGAEIFKMGFMKKLNAFIDEKFKDDDFIFSAGIVEKVVGINKGNRYFNIKCIIFSDKSFEIIITDETKKEKNKVIKSQITSNIAHELKTPVSAIHAYLETLLQNAGLKKDQKRYFISKAFSQVQRLSQLISDISTINKLDYAEEFFEIEQVNVYDIVEDIKINTQFRREEKKIEFQNELEKNLELTGNKELMYSIFQNLVENTINYGGTKIKIVIKKLYEDNEYYYFSYMNTGANIQEEHLNRIFERFYRVDSGRTRKNGGTGLGLSITKNAVKFHYGEISAKNLSNGGVEFLFFIKKQISARQ